jgi:serine/threonine protein kinase
MKSLSAKDDPAVEALVTEVADQFVERLKAGEQPDVEEYARRYPENATVLRQVLTALQIVRLCGSAGAAEGKLTSASGMENCLGDYRLLREVGRGGMGVVYEAEQISLKRRVALKVLPLAPALDARQLQRFKNEAQAAACLHHTNIVPVHAVGSERGLHYYAMQFIDGQTLAEVIAQLRCVAGKRVSEPEDGSIPPPSTAGAKAQEPRPVSLEPLASAQTAVVEASGTLATVLETGGSVTQAAFFRTVARLGLQAAEALEHAHQMGVVHRDIKPANLLVDVRGNLWVTDFGLAQLPTDARLTMTGDLLGTLRYMSPEQALAQRGVVDHRTDVYSLGVTLYELLTLEPAFPGSDRNALLHQIANDDPRAPRRVNKAIPADLETIVGKAVTKEPEGRYATAQDMADDLRRFLEDKPVRARRPSARQRLAKWARRHRAVVRAGVVVLILALVGMTSSFALIWKQTRATDKALVHARAMQALAESAVEHMLTRVADNWLEDEVRGQPLQQEFLNKALDYYKRIAAENAEDPGVREQTGRAYLRVGNLQQKLGQYTEAQEAYSKGIELFEKLGRDYPGIPSHGKYLASCLNSQGAVLLLTGHRNLALHYYMRARNLMEPLAAANDNPSYQDDLANFLSNLASTLDSVARLGEAEQHYNQAVQVRLKLCERFPKEASYQHGLAIIRHNRGTIYLQTRRFDACEQEAKAGQALARDLVERFPRHRKYRETLGHCHQLLGVLYSARGQWKEAETLCRQSIVLHKQLAADFPQVVGYRGDLASCYYHLGRVLRGTGALTEAEQYYRKVVELRKLLVLDLPDVIQHQSQLAASLNDLGQLLREVGRPADGREAYAQALALLEREPARFGNTPYYLEDLTTYQNNLAYADWLAGRLGEAEEMFRKAIALREQLVDENPKTVVYREKLVGTYTNLGGVLQQVARLAEAERALRNAVAHQEKLLADFPEVLYHLHALTQGRTRLGQILRQLGRLEDSRQEFRKVEQMWRDRLTLKPRDSFAHRYLARYLANCPDPTLRDPPRAVELAQTALTMAEIPSAEFWVTLGLAHYRVGDWKAAVQALEKAEGAGQPAVPCGDFFRAMAHWQQGHKDEARRLYGRGLADLKKSQSKDEELLRSRAEAVTVLGFEGTAVLPTGEERTKGPWQPLQRPVHQKDQERPNG